ncbi:MAG: hypothetical protein ACI837_003455 [Crocinitomicaceae bacterium]|jgi:hypothetical protein
MKESVDLTFSCNEDFSEMSYTDRGRFCTACQKEVIDYTDHRIEDINALSKSGAELCGIFRADQLDPSLHPIRIPHKVKSFAYLSSLFIWLGTTNVNAQSTVDPKLVLSEGTSNAPQLTPEETEEQLQTGTPISMSIGNSVSKVTTEITPEENTRLDKKAARKQKRHAKKMSRRYTKKWYWSKRFPFFHKRRFSAGKF